MSPQVAPFDWDDANLNHLARHHVTKQEVTEAFLDPFCRHVSRNLRNGEIRYEVVGQTESGRILTMVFTVRKWIIRPVTAYDAPKKRVAYYVARRSNGQTSTP